MKYTEKATLKQGDFLRKSKVEGLFEKGYLANWPEGLFQVATSVNYFPAMRYQTDLAGEKIKSAFYEQEMQQVTQPDRYWVEKVIKTRTRKGLKEFLLNGIQKNVIAG